MKSAFICLFGSLVFPENWHAFIQDGEAEWIVHLPSLVPPLALTGAVVRWLKERNTVDFV